jgi:hypothetical protein
MALPETAGDGNAQRLSVNALERELATYVS